MSRGLIRTGSRPVSRLASPRPRGRRRRPLPKRRDCDVLRRRTRRQPLAGTPRRPSHRPSRRAPRAGCRSLSPGPVPFATRGRPRSARATRFLIQQDGSFGGAGWPRSNRWVPPCKRSPRGPHRRSTATRAIRLLQGRIRDLPPTPRGNSRSGCKAAASARSSAPRCSTRSGTTMACMPSGDCTRRSRSQASMAMRSESGSRAACRQQWPASACGSARSTFHPFAARATSKLLTAGVSRRKPETRIGGPAAGTASASTRSLARSAPSQADRERNSPSTALPQPRKACWSRVRGQRESFARSPPWARSRSQLARARSPRSPGSRRPGASRAVSRQSQCKAEAGRMPGSEGRSAEALCHCCRSQASSGSTWADGQALRPAATCARSCSRRRMRAWRRSRVSSRPPASRWAMHRVFGFNRQLP